MCTLNTGGRLTQTWIAQSIGNLKSKFALCLQCVSNRTVLKMENKEVEETIKTINSIQFIIKAHIMKVFSHKISNLKETMVNELQNVDEKKWFLVFGDRLSLNAG